MPGGEFNVVFKGLSKDTDPEAIKKKLASIYKGDVSKVEVFFKGRAVVVKKGVDRETAQKFCDLFTKAGTVCRVVRQGQMPAGGSAGRSQAAPKAAPKTAPKAVQTAAPKAAPKKRFQNPMTCPNCGHKQEKSDSCLKCGVVVEKFLKKNAPPEEPAKMEKKPPIGQPEEDIPSVFPGRAAILQEEDDREPISFWEHYPRAFAYPFKGKGAFVLLAGTIFYTFVHYLLFIPFVGGMLSLFTSCYLLAYFFKVMTSSADGEEAAPDWPDFSNAFGDIIAPVLKTILVGLVSFTPALLILIIRPAADWQTNLLIIGGMVILGALYYPMALLAFVMSGRIAGLTPIIVIPAIVKMPLTYLVVLMTYGFLIVVGALGRGFVNLPVPIVGTIISVAIGMYYSMVQMRLLGLMYAANADRLNWFGEY